MSKITEELDFMWEKRVLEYYQFMEQQNVGIEDSDDMSVWADKMQAIRDVLKLQGLTVKGIEG